MPSLNPSGMFLTDIQDLAPVMSVPAGAVTANAGSLSTDALFWTGQNDSVDRQGVQDDTNWTANTYKTILSLTATKRAFFSGFIGPTLNSGETLQLRVTTDGAAYTSSPYTAQVTGDRIVIGPMLPRESTFTSAARVLGLTSGTSSDGITLRISETQVVATQFALLWGSPIIRCLQSLLIEARISVSLSTTTNRERRSGAYYVRTV